MTGLSIKKVSGMANNKTRVCDTNVLIYFFAGNAKAGEIIAQSNIAVSSMTSIELQVNSRQTVKERDIINDFLGGVTLVETNLFINELAIKFRLTYNLLVPDAIIAATAKYLGASLATADASFFKIKEIEIIPFSK